MRKAGAHSLTLTTPAAGGGAEGNIMPARRQNQGMVLVRVLRFSKVGVGRVGCIVSRVIGGSFKQLQRPWDGALSGTAASWHKKPGNSSLLELSGATQSMGQKRPARFPRLCGC